MTPYRSLLNSSVKPLTVLRSIFIAPHLENLLDSLL
nr:MAG TPA: hypothetical protein [Caudoviricetes sp.]